MTPLWSGISDKRQARIRKAVKEEEDRFEDKLNEERRLFSIFAREVQFLALARASASGKEAVQAEKQMKKWGRLRALAGLAMMLSHVPILSLNYASGFFLILASFVGCFIIFTIWWRSEMLEVKRLREISNGYLSIVDLARIRREIDASTATMKELGNFRNAIWNGKHAWDNEYHPRLEDLEEAKTLIQLFEPTPDLFRVFDQKLEEAQRDDQEIELVECENERSKKS